MALRRNSIFICIASPIHAIEAGPTVNSDPHPFSISLKLTSLYVVVIRRPLAAIPKHQQTTSARRSPGKGKSENGKCCTDRVHPKVCHAITVHSAAWRLPPVPCSL